MFIFELWFLLCVVLPLMVIGVGVGGAFHVAPKEMSDLVKRSALVARSHLGSSKAKTVLVKEKMALDPYTGAKDDKKALAEWQSKFDGKELMLVAKDAHRIVNSWNELVDDMYDGLIEKWWWECACGEKEDRKTKDAAKNAANRHIKTYQGRDDAGIRDYGWYR